MYPSLVVVIISLKRSVVENSTGFDASPVAPTSLEKAQFKPYSSESSSSGAGSYGYVEQSNSLPWQLGSTQLGTKFQIETLGRDVV